MTAKAPQRVSRARTARSTRSTAGQRLVAEFIKDEDPFSFTFQVDQVAQLADHLQRLTALLEGDRSSWRELKIGAKTVEVIVTDVLRQHRATVAQLEKSLVALRRQRAVLDAGGSAEDDVLDDEDD